MATLIGILSDTHGLLRPEVLEALQECRVLLHAGDIGDGRIIERLEESHEVVAVRGNADRGPWAEGLKGVERVRLAGRRILLIHDLAELRERPSPSTSDIVVYGHSHQPSVEYRRGVLYLNPGSAGPRRFKLPVSVAVLRMEGAGLQPEIIRIE